MLKSSLPTPSPDMIYKFCRINLGNNFLMTEKKKVLAKKVYLTYLV